MFCSGVFVGDYIQFSLISGESRDAGASEDPLREAFSHRRAPAGRCGGLRVWRSLRRHTERPRPGMVNQSFQLISFQKGYAWTIEYFSVKQQKEYILGRTDFDLFGAHYFLGSLGHN